jgi:hypothetical protein
MMGVNYGYQPKMYPIERKKYALTPTKTTSGKWIFLKHYWQVYSLTTVMIMSEKEYFVHMMKFPKAELKPPSGKSGIYYCGNF